MENLISSDHSRRPFSQPCFLFGLDQGVPFPRLILCALVGLHPHWHCTYKIMLVIFAITVGLKPHSLDERCSSTPRHPTVVGCYICGGGEQTDTLHCIFVLDVLAIAVGIEASLTHSVSDVWARHGGWCTTRLGRYTFRGGEQTHILFHQYKTWEQLLKQKVYV